MSDLAEGYVAALSAIRDALEQIGAPSMFIGGLAVIASGVARFTADIDATFRASGVDLAQAFRTFEQHGIEPRVPDALAFAQRHQVLLLRHVASRVPVDVSLAWLPFEEAALGHAEEHAFQGVNIRIPRAEDLIVYKIVASRPRDLDDAQKLLALHGPTIDVKRLRATVTAFCDVLEDGTRLETLERLVRQTPTGRPRGQ